MTKKKQLSITMNEEKAKKIEQIAKKTGLSVNNVINLYINGYDIIETDENGNKKSLLHDNN